jgi:hypothetical protein
MIFKKKAEGSSSTSDITDIPELPVPNPKVGPGKELLITA